ncbi:hypothetical protein WJX74_003604 [Apatococcus lobatus]|uniref:Uncharacterized protein n=2 Tax=Apatococcus TaxID=904362 RepID=A0AAW1SDA5_9CHLO
MALDFLTSLLGWRQAHGPPQVVLVPPLFERDHRGRGRMSRSSYDTLFCKPALRWLFQDYLAEGLQSVMRFAPPEDPKVSVNFRFGASLKELGSNSAGSLALRYQLDAMDPLSFIDVKASARETSEARMRGCYFHVPSGLGIFGSVPLLQQVSDNEKGPELGLRWSSPDVTAGAIVLPYQDSQTAWLAGRLGPLTLGMQYYGGQPFRQDWPGKARQAAQQRKPDALAENAQNALSDLQQNISYAVAYSPQGSSPYGRGNFTAVVEIREARELGLAFFYHLAVQRLVRNPLEDHRSVAGITNYVDFGLQAVVDLAAQQAAAKVQKGRPGPISRKAAGQAEAAVPTRQPALRLGLAWQMNKNVMLKAKVGTDALTAALAVKSWGAIGTTGAASVGWNIQRQQRSFGFALAFENYGNIRYERSKGRPRVGSALVQRHVALPEDIANKEGAGLMVKKEDLENKHILGQHETASSQYL